VSPAGLIVTKPQRWDDGFDGRAGARCASPPRARRPALERRVIIVDPVRDLRISEDQLRAVDPLMRARARMEAGEEIEEAEREEAVRAARELGEARAIQQEMLDRQQLARQGFTDREAERARAEREAIREGRVAEHLEELARLDPARFGGTASRSDRLHLEFADGTGRTVTAGGSDRTGVRAELDRVYAGRAHFAEIKRRMADREADEISRARRAEIAAIEAAHPELAELAGGPLLHRQSRYPVSAGRLRRDAVGMPVRVGDFADF